MSPAIPTAQYAFVGHYVSRTDRRWAFSEAQPLQ